VHVAIAVPAAGRNGDALAAGPAGGSATDVGVVIATRNRRTSLLRTLTHLSRLPWRPRIVLVDNASSDGTPDAVRALFPGVELVELEDNLGASARTVGVMRLDTPFVAFSDDDSWWARQALGRAVETFAAHPRLGLLAARILVGPERRIDPTSRAMEQSPLPLDPLLPGRPVLGFLACGAVVRRSAFLEIGGFERRYGTGGEEHLFALDLAAAGWGLAYVEEVVAHHHPSKANCREGRRLTELRNAFWSTWLRRPVRTALGHTRDLLRTSSSGDPAREAFVAALRGLPWVLRERRRVPAEIERGLRLMKGPGLRSSTRAAPTAAEPASPAWPAAQRYGIPLGQEGSAG
jgi:GT2 family glycosyltransferase